MGIEIIGSLVSLIVLAIIVEAIVGVIKKILPDKVLGVEVPLILGIGIGISIALLTGYNLFEPLGFEIKSRVVAEIITGVAAGGGSKAVHELLAKLRASRDDIADRTLIQLE